MLLNHEDLVLRILTTPNEGFIRIGPLPPLKQTALMLVQICHDDQPLFSRVLGMGLREAKNLANQGIPHVESLDAEDRETINRYLEHRNLVAVERMDAIFRAPFRKDSGKVQ